MLLSEIEIEGPYEFVMINGSYIIDITDTEILISNMWGLFGFEAAALLNQLGANFDCEVKSWNF